MNPQNTPVKVYISYDPSDAERLERLIVHMTVMLQENRVALWYRNAALAGDEVEKEAKTRLEKADLVLFLISPDYLASKFYLSEASKEILGQKESLKTKLVPIYLCPCDFKRTRLFEFEAMLSKERPIIDYIRKNDKDKPFYEIVDRLWGLIEEIEKAKSVTPFAPPQLQPDLNFELPPELESRSPKPEENDSPIAIPLLERAVVIPAETLLPVPILPEYFLPREEELAGLLDILLSTEGAVAITGVQGMGGIGKSVLAAAVALDERLKARFSDGIFWLVVGQTPDLVSLQSSLAVALGDKSAITSVEEGKALLAKLLQDKTCLLVLDDVWKPEHAQALTLTGATGKTLVTTRKEEVVTGLGARHYTLDKMTPAQALGLLARAALTNGQLPETAKEIAHECGYLPLALSICGAMAYERGHDWEYVLAKLKEGGLEGVFKSIEVSLNDQPDLIGYYLDLAVFPEDTAIPLEALEALWGSGRQETEEIAIRLGHASLVRWQAGYIQLTLHDLQYDYVWLKRQGELLALHRRLVEGYRKNCGGVWWQGQDDGYFYEKICWHLLEAGLVEELRELLLDYRWIEAKLVYKGANALPEDYALLPDDQELRLVGRAMTQSAHVLTQDTGQLANQITGRLMGMGLPGLDKLVEQTQQAEVKGLRLLSPTLTGADSPLIRTFEGHTSEVMAVAIAPDGNQIVTASADTTLKLWDLASGQLIRTFKGHTWGVNAVAITPDGSRAISASSDNTLKLWDLASGQLIRTFEGHTDVVNTVAITPDGSHVISASNDNTLKLWDLTSGLFLRTFQGHTSRVTAVAITTDGSRIISASADNTLKLWDLVSGQLIHSFEGHTEGVKAVAIIPNGSRAISASSDNTLKLWDLISGHLLRSFQGHTDIVNGVAITPDGSQVISASSDNTLKLWDLASGQPLRTFKGHTYWVTGVAITLDGSRIISASADTTLKLWDINNGECMVSIPMDAPLFCCAISQDGKTVLAGDNLGNVHFLRLEI